MKPVLILSPHCDDAPLSLGASLLAGTWGRSVRTVVIFSQSGYTRFHGWADSIPEISALRQDEERRAAALAGYAVEFLPFGEPYVRPGYADIGQVFDAGRNIEDEPIWGDVRASLMDLLGRWEGVVLAPLGLGNHIDHRIVRACCLEAAERFPRILPGFYEDLPYAADYSSLHIYSVVPASIRNTAPQPLALRGGALEDKLRLLGVYDSQLTEAQLHNVTAHWECRGRAELVWLVPGPDGQVDAL